MREAARLVGLQLQIGKVRQARRGAAEAMVPRLDACVVPRVVCRCAAYVPALVSMSAMRTLTMYSSEGFTERFG